MVSNSHTRFLYSHNFFFPLNSNAIIIYEVYLENFRDGLFRFKEIEENSMEAELALLWATSDSFEKSVETS